MNELHRLLLRLLEGIDLSQLDDVGSRWVRRLLCTSPTMVQRLSTHPTWQGRWASLREATRVLGTERAWALALHMGADPDAVVRRAAAETLARLWKLDAGHQAELERCLVSTATPDVLRETLLDACSEVFFHHPEALDQAVALLSLAGRQPPAGALLEIGSRRLGFDLERTHPERAQALSAEWKASNSASLCFHARWTKGWHPLSVEQLRTLVGEAPVPPAGWRSTSDVPPAPALDEALVCREHVLLAALLSAVQGRAVILRGGTTESRRRLAHAAANALPAGTDDVTARPNPRDPSHPIVERAPGGTANISCEYTHDRRHRQRRRRQIAWWTACAASTLAIVLSSALSANAGPISASILWPLAASVVLLTLCTFRHSLTHVPPAPGLRVLASGSVLQPAPFEDASQLSDEQLFGGVRKRIQPAAPHERLSLGALHRAHGGVLFIDSLAALTSSTQQELLHALKRERTAIHGRNISSSVVQSRSLPCKVLLVLGEGVDQGASSSLDPEFSRWLERKADVIDVETHVPDSPATRHRVLAFMGQLVRNRPGSLRLSREAVAAVCEQLASRCPQPSHLELDLRLVRSLVDRGCERAEAEHASLVTVQHISGRSGEAVTA